MWDPPSPSSAPTSAPSSGPVFVPVPVAVPVPPPPPGHGRATRRTWPKRLVLLGLALLVGAVASMAVGIVRLGELVESMARAPVSCTTTLEVSAPGRYDLYLETKAKVSAVEGTCSLPATVNRRGTVTPPTIRISTAAGAPVEVRDATGAHYDTADFTGRKFAEFDAAAAGEIQVAVAGADREVIVAIARSDADPEALLRVFQIVAAAVAVAGLAALIAGLVGLRRNRPVNPPFQPRPIGPSTWGTGPPPPPR